MYLILQILKYIKQVTDCATRNPV